MDCAHAEIRWVGIRPSVDAARMHDRIAAAVLRRFTLVGCSSFEQERTREHIVDRIGASSVECAFDYICNAVKCICTQPRFRVYGNAPPARAFIGVPYRYRTSDIVH
jgi:hypothetical protein